MDNLPKFLIVGAAKSGTTTLYHFLKQHPEIFMPTRKEPRFFVRELVGQLNKENPLAEKFLKGTKTKFDNYSNLFKNKKDEKTWGEASTAYLYNYKIAIPEIKRYLGSDVKIIIILRNPINRAYSSYYHLLRVGAEKGTFEECLEKEEYRKNNNWIQTLFMLKTAGLYYEQVKAYMDNFKNIRIYLTDDLKEDPKSLVQDMYSFLGVDSSFTPNLDRKFNQGMITTNPIVSFILRISYRNKVLSKLIKTGLFE